MDETTEETTEGTDAGTDAVQNLPLLPLTSGVVLPGMVFTMALESDEARAAVEAAESAGGRFLLVPHIDGRYASVGVIAEVMEEGELPGGLQAVVVRGVERAAIGTGGARHRAGPVGRGRDASRRRRADARGERAGPRVPGRAREHPAEPGRAVASPSSCAEVTEPGRVADMAGYSPDLSLAQKVEVLETLDVEARLRLVLGWARDTLADLTLRERIKTDVEEGMEKTQREFLLRRQLEAIRKELGQMSSTATTTTPTTTGRSWPSRDLPEDVAQGGRAGDRQARAHQRAEPRARVDPHVARHGARAPLGRASPRTASTWPRPPDILDDDHDGLDDVKERILEHLAVRKLQAERGLAPGRRARARAPSWPWSVLRASARRRSGESVARALGRKFVRVSLGGVRDEAEIRGHRRTYVGAQPGRLVRALREAGTMNPVIVLDEVDKLGADYRGDPSSALLEVLDPAQNHTFRDHYLEVDLDLSRGAVHRHGQRGRHHPRAAARPDGGHPARRLHRGREGRHRPPPPGRAPAGACRAAGRRGDHHRRRVARHRGATTPGRPACGPSSASSAGCSARWRPSWPPRRPTAPVAVDAGDVRGWLGRPRFFFEAADRTAVPGVATGLAVTGAGGDVLFVEATVMDGPEGLTLTGQLGDVMKESAEIALSYVRSHAEELGIDPAVFAGKRFHVHVPAGAVPKDGPSAGVTMTTALVSLLRDVPVRSVVGMTGEVTLQGRVLPIGGVKQKVLAAHRAGLTEVVLPARNGPDLEDVPEAVRDEMTFHLAATSPTCWMSPWPTTPGWPPRPVRRRTRGRSRWLPEPDRATEPFRGWPGSPSRILASSTGRSP